MKDFIFSILKIYGLILIFWLYQITKGLLGYEPDFSDSRLALFLSISALCYIFYNPNRANQTKVKE